MLKPSKIFFFFFLQFEQYSLWPEVSSPCGSWHGTWRGKYNVYSCIISKTRFIKCFPVGQKKSQLSRHIVNMIPPLTTLMFMGLTLRGKWIGTFITSVWLIPCFSWCLLGPYVIIPPSPIISLPDSFFPYCPLLTWCPLFFRVLVSLLFSFPWWPLLAISY